MKEKGGKRVAKHAVTSECSLLVDKINRSFLKLPKSRVIMMKITWIKLTTKLGVKI